MDSNEHGDDPTAASKKMFSRPMSRANSASSITDMYETLGGVEFHSLDYQDSDLLITRPRAPSVGSLQPATMRSHSQLHAASAMELDLGDVGRKSIASCNRVLQATKTAPPSGRSGRKQGSVHCHSFGEFMENAPSSKVMRSSSMGVLRATKHNQSISGLLPALKMKGHNSLDLAEWNSCRKKPAHGWADTSAVF